MHDLTIDQGRGRQTEAPRVLKAQGNVGGARIHQEMHGRAVDLTVGPVVAIGGLDEAGRFGLGALAAAQRRIGRRMGGGAGQDLEGAEDCQRSGGGDRRVPEHRALTW